MDFAARARALVAQMTVEEQIRQLFDDSPAIERLGIPAYVWWNECLHGSARSGTATVFPQAIGLAASFNTALMREVASAISDEARAKYNQYSSFGGTLRYEGLTMCAPNINIYRDPRWGRGQETYGEDPYLTGEMAVAYVQGLQGEGEYHKCDATLKHFAVHSGPEALRHGFDARPSEEDLESTYLWAFRHCIERARPAAVMFAYNAVLGEPCCISRRLHRTLREDWRFDGYLESDAGGVDDLHAGHGVTKDAAQSAAAALSAGCQLRIVGGRDDLLEAFRRDLVNEAQISAACEKLFEARFRLGMFDADCPHNAIPYEVVECEAHAALNRRMAAEGVVLLKNDGILPLAPGKTLAVIGPSADDLSVLKGNYFGTPSEYATPLTGIRAANGGRVYYAEGCDATGAAREETDEQLLREALIAARMADAVILVMGLNQRLEGEEGMGGDRATIELPAAQRKLLRAISALGKPMVFVSISGGCVSLVEADARCNAVMQLFYPGAQGGHALADVLFGRVSPSGRLPVTFYRSDADLPPFESYDMAGRTYRFFRGEPLYPFGHGLSYARFTYAQPRYEGGVASATVVNEGPMDAARAVLLFDERALIGFEKVFLRAGESARVRMEVGDGRKGLRFS